MKQINLDERKPSKDFSSRRKTAEKFRENAEDNLKEILLFICPGREKDFDKNNSNRPYDQEDETDETFSSLYEDLASDFASDIVAYYTPSEASWTDYTVTAPVEEDQADAVEELVTQREEDIADLIMASNYYDVAPQVAFEANHGTMSMWVEQSHLSEPIFIETVPPNELLITPGHQGLLDRFREKWVAAHLLEVTLESWDVDLKIPALQEKMKKVDQYCKVCWGFWADWTDPGNPQWKVEITVDGKRVTPPEAEAIGPIQGSCPLHVGRFNPQVGKPWGRGPAWKALRDMRVLDAIKEGILDGIDQSLRSTLIYADDGFIDIENGIIPGSGIPAARGFTRDQIYELQQQANLDPGFFSEERIEQRLREGFYQDGPRQTGDTPPTATQWVDERRRVQQRIGKPSAPLWREFYLPFIQRIEYLGAAVGKFDIELTHQSDVISIQSVSPLQKASNQDKVTTSRSNLDLAAGIAGDQIGSVIDLQGTFAAIVDASGDELTKIAKAPPAGTPPEGNPDDPTAAPPV